MKLRSLNPYRVAEYEEMLHSESRGNHPSGKVEDDPLLGIICGQMKAKYKPQSILNSNL